MHAEVLCASVLLMWLRMATRVREGIIGRLATRLGSTARVQFGQHINLIIFGIQQIFQLSDLRL